MPSLLLLPVAVALLANVPEPAPEAWDPPAAVPPQQAESHWYGGPALAVDGAAILGVIAADRISGSHQSTATAMLYGMVGVYLAGGPILHLVHGNDDHASESFLLRLGGVAAGVAMVYAIALDSSSGCGAEASAHTACPAVYGLVAPTVLAMLIDDLVLARDPATQPAAPTVSTRVVVQPGLALFGVGGTF